MRKTTRLFPILFVLLLAACATKSYEEINDDIVGSDAAYDSIGDYVAGELLAIKAASLERPLTLDEEQRALDLYAVFQNMAEYKANIDALKVEPTGEGLRKASDLWEDITSEAKRLGWEVPE